MAKNDNVEFGNFRKNIMGTLSFEMKLPNMRKAQDFIVYPVNEKTDYIMIQSDTRIGKIEMTTGRGLMSQSHPNGAYFVHFHIDKLVKFELTESQLEKLKEEIAKTAGRNVGSAGVVSDNEYADKFAKGGQTDSLYKIQQKYKYDLQPKWEDEKFQTGGRHFLTFKQAQEIKNKLKGLSSSMEYKVVKVEEKFAAGGELVDKTIDHSGKYLDIVGNHRMLHIHLNDEGREMVMEERESGRDDEEIMYDLFEDVSGNSDLLYHTDLGVSGFGMTSSSGVTAGYVYGDDGELEPADDTAVVYVDNDSYRRSPIEEMLHTHLVLKNSDFMAKGGMTFGGKMHGAGMFADGGGIDYSKTVTNRFEQCINFLKSQKLYPYLFDLNDVTNLYDVTPEMAYQIYQRVADKLLPWDLVKKTIHQVAKDDFGLVYEDDMAKDWYAKGGQMAKGGRTGKSLKVKDWYMKNYPTDDLGSEINDTISFKDLWAYMSQGNNVYDVLGVGDSLVRERVFEKLSEVYGVEYDAVYKMWVNS